MYYRVFLTEEAQFDLREAYLYYEQKNAGLGDRFLSQVEEQLSILSKHPEYYSFIDLNSTLRDVAISKFPFVIIYMIKEREIIIHAVLATKKRPKY
ncbi:MAG: type II toxin-antitoxin system RelE/ParE family toxin [Taibaiella sp.]|nr:type II toxin-antitoxin system RelE/ParE family toxin [Taibaiella sp.]